jgi:hypothetical protein
MTLYLYSRRAGCKLGKWRRFAKCSKSCGGGVKKVRPYTPSFQSNCLWFESVVFKPQRERTVVSPQKLGGAPCASTVEVRACHVQPCPTTTASPTFFHATWAPTPAPTAPVARRASNPTTSKRCICIFLHVFEQDGDLCALFFVHM